MLKLIDLHAIYTEATIPQIPPKPAQNYQPVKPSPPLVSTTKINLQLASSRNSNSQSRPNTQMAKVPTQIEQHRTQNNIRRNDLLLNQIPTCCQFISNAKSSQTRFNCRGNSNALANNALRRSISSPAWKMPAYFLARGVNDLPFS